MGNEAVFGGKVIFMGGDFHVVPGDPLAVVVDAYNNRSNLWHRFQKFKLTQNMRANVNEQEFSKWLLQLGNGRLFTALNDVATYTIAIPVVCCKESLVTDIFDGCTPEEMEQRVILSPKNANCLTVN